MKLARWIVYLIAVVVLALHQDFWNWGKVDPKLFGVLPVGLWYHALFCVACSVVMWLLLQVAWPKHLEEIKPEDGKLLHPDSHGH
jgi:hypothetical protein